MNIFESYRQAYRQYADFSGRTRRADYWGYVLTNAIITLTFALAFVVAMVLLGIDKNNTKFMAFPILTIMCIWGLYYLVTFLPSLSIAVRRLHDAGYSGLMVLLYLVPLGSLVVLIFLFMDSQNYLNKWGHSPKYYGNPNYGNYLGTNQMPPNNYYNNPNNQNGNQWNNQNNFPPPPSNSYSNQNFKPPPNNL